ncbi:MAG: hypothetical protein M5U28_21550 [Sandaracinaceae bacterium]|nr:hypothetical protein [Sandaracinaceae bacterium]
MHATPSEQSRATPTHDPALHTSSVVQNAPSSQDVPSVALVHESRAEDGSQTSHALAGLRWPAA